MGPFMFPIKRHNTNDLSVFFSKDSHEKSPLMPKRLPMSMQLQGKYMEEWKNMFLMG